MTEGRTRWEPRWNALDPDDPKSDVVMPGEDFRRLRSAWMQRPTQADFVAEWLVSERDAHVIESLEWQIIDRLLGNYIVALIRLDQGGDP